MDGLVYKKVYMYKNNSARFDVHVQMWKCAVLHIKSQTGVLRFLHLDNLIAYWKRFSEAVSKRTTHYFISISTKACTHRAIENKAPKKQHTAEHFADKEF